MISHINLNTTPRLSVDGMRCNNGDRKLASVLAALLVTVLFQLLPIRALLVQTLEYGRAFLGPHDVAPRDGLATTRRTHIRTLLAATCSGVQPQASTPPAASERRVSKRRNNGRFSHWITRNAEEVLVVRY
jgi:hypothetical protein